MVNELGLKIVARLVRIARKNTGVTTLWCGPVEASMPV
jgi:hypothetical protein